MRRSVLIALRPFTRTWRLLALPVDAATSERLDGLVAAGMLQEAIFKAVADLLTCIATQTPLVVVLEDLHWADVSSLALLDYLLSLTDTTSLLLLMVMRPIPTHGSWRLRERVIRDYDHRHTDAELAPLSEEESAALIHRLVAAGGNRAVADLTWAKEVQERAEGNPFFTAEIVRSLMEEGMTADELPATVQGVLMARIDRLSLTARQVLQLAAVIGHTFRYRLLADIVMGSEQATGTTTAALDATLLQLVRAQMIREQARDLTRAYAFEHQLTLEAAYSSLLRRKRRSLHRRVAEALERLYPDEVEGQLGRLAYHWTAAGDREQAVNYLKRAAEQAAAQYALEEALDHLTQALALVPEDNLALRYELLLQRDQVIAVFGDHGARFRDLAELERLADRLGDPRCRAEVLLRTARHLALNLRIDSALERGQTALNLALKVDDLALEARAHIALGQALAEQWNWTRGKQSVSIVREAERHFDRAQALARAIERHDLQATSLRVLGALLMNHNRLDAAIARLVRARELYRQLRHPHEEWALGYLAYCCTAKCELARARRYAEERLHLAQELGAPMSVAWAQLDVAGIAAWQGDYQTALTLTQAGLRKHRQFDVGETSGGENLGELGGLDRLGHIWLALGVYDRARRTFEELALITNRRGDPQREGVAVCGLARLCLYAGDHNGALAHVDRVFGIADALGERSNFAFINHAMIQALMVKGHALAALNRLDEAVDAYNQALDRARGTTWTPISAVEPRAGLARVALARNDLDAALAQVEPLLEVIDTPAMDCAMESASIFLTCYRVLAAHEDPRADEVLATGYRWLMKRADTIEDEALRRSYLENVAANRELVAAYEEAKLH